MLEQQTNELDAIVARWQQLLDLHGRDLTRWPPEAEAEIYALPEAGTSARPARATLTATGQRSSP